MSNISIWRGSKKAFVFSVFLLFVTVTKLLAQESGLDDRQYPKDAKIINEYDDGKGHIVREVQYNQGMMRVTETIIMPKRPKSNLGLRVPILPDTMDMDSVLVFIDKSKYCVQVYYKRRMIRYYKAVFGPQPKMNKLMEGDRCTPEGWFKISDKHISRNYNKFLGISYPDQKDYERFKKLKAEGTIPTNARIGGNIGIHGIWEGGDDMIEMGIGWTDGCIAIKNHDVDDLYRITGVGSRVYIQK